MAVASRGRVVVVGVVVVGMMMFCDECRSRQTPKPKIPALSLSLKKRERENQLSQPPRDRLTGTRKGDAKNCDRLRQRAVIAGANRQAGSDKTRASRMRIGVLVKAAVSCYHTPPTKLSLVFESDFVAGQLTSCLEKMALTGDCCCARRQAPR